MSASDILIVVSIQLRSPEGRAVSEFANAAMLCDCGACVHLRSQRHGWPQQPTGKSYEMALMITLVSTPEKSCRIHHGAHDVGFFWQAP